MDDGTSQFSALVRSGTAGALAVCALGMPLDVARHASQAALAKKRAAPGFVEALRGAAAPGVVGGLWLRGIGPALFVAAASPASFLVFYEVFKHDREPIVAGMMGRAVQTTLVQPFDLLRTCRQGAALLPVTEATKYLERDMWDVITIDRPRSLWRGLLPTLMRDVSASGVFWLSYIQLRSVVAAATEGPDEHGGDSPFMQSPWSSAMCASASALTAAILTQPMDIIKTRMQVHQFTQPHESGVTKIVVPRVIATAREVFKFAGVGGFWIGAVPRALHAAAAAFILGPLFEYCQHVATDDARPRREILVLGEDPSRTIIHPRASSATFVELTKWQDRNK